MERDWPSVVPTFSPDPHFRLVRTGVFPTYSPDGRRLAAHTGLAAIFHNTIVVMNSDGTNRRPIFEDPAKNAVAPVWSPVGDRIAFDLGAYNTGMNRGVESHVVTMATNGSDLRSLTCRPARQLRLSELVAGRQTSWCTVPRREKEGAS